MNRISFTADSLRKLALKRKRYNVFDQQVAGLGLAVHPSGRKTFFHLRKVEGYPQRQTIGMFPDVDLSRAKEISLAINSKIVAPLARYVKTPKHKRAKSPSATAVAQWQKINELKIRIRALKSELRVQKIRHQRSDSNLRSSVASCMTKIEFQIQRIARQFGFK